MLSQYHFDKIQAFYNSTDIAAGYGRQQYITPCERLLFDAYIRPGMAVLDAGVGGGRTSEYLARKASRYVGIDYAPAMVEICRRKYPQWEYAVGSVTDLSSFQNGSFDAVVMSYNMLDDVVPDEGRWRCLQECHRVLNGNGLLIFSSHNPRSVLVRPAMQAARARASAKAEGGQGHGMPRRTDWFQRFLRSLGEASSAAVLSASAMMRYAARPAFWRGEGYMFDAHALMTHFWIPAKAVEELSRFNFRLVTVQGDDYPLKSHSLITEWYYYVFRKEELTP